MVEAGLQQLGEVVVLRRADEAGDVEARERARTRVQVHLRTKKKHNSIRFRLMMRILQKSYQKYPERVSVELNDGELCLRQLGLVHLLPVGAEAQLGDRELRDAVRVLLLLLLMLVVVVGGGGGRLGLGVAVLATCNHRRGAVMRSFLGGLHIDYKPALCR